MGRAKPFGVVVVVVDLSVSAVVKALRHHLTFNARIYKSMHASFYFDTRALGNSMSIHIAPSESRTYHVDVILLLKALAL